MKKILICDCGSDDDVKRDPTGLACKKCRKKSSGLKNPHRTNKLIKNHKLDLNDFGELKINMKTIYE